MNQCVDTWMRQCVDMSMRQCVEYTKPSRHVLQRHVAQHVTQCVAFVEVGHKYSPKAAVRTQRGSVATIKGHCSWISQSAFRWVPSWTLLTFAFRLGETKSVIGKHVEWCVIKLMHAHSQCSRERDLWEGGMHNDNRGFVRHLLIGWFEVYSASDA